jgi:N-acetylneuraminic acid mutarotase
MKRSFLVTAIVLIAVAAHAQGTWTQKTTFSGPARSYSPVGFAIGTKGYGGTGYNGSTYYNDFWEWDSSTDTWTQRANFFASRMYAAGFELNGKGYMGLGKFVSTTYNDFWQYDPSTNAWTQKASFPGTGRSNAVAFSINGKGYIGGGGIGGTSLTYYNDFYQYNPISNTWASRTSFSTIGGTGIVSFAVNGKGYAGLGHRNIYRNDMWEYDPVADTWTQKGNFPGGTRTVSSAFVIGNYAYVGGGYNGSSDQQDFWRWEPVSDTWVQKANMGAGPWSQMIGFSVNGKGYFTLGRLNGNHTNVLWEYDPGNLCSGFTFSPVSGNVSCFGDTNGSITVNVTAGSAPYQYSIDGGATYQSSSTFSPLATGTYTVVVTDYNNCLTNTQTVNISEPSPLTFTYSSADATCNSANDGSIVVSAIGGTPAYQYSIDSGANYQSSAAFNGLAPGAYTIMVQDANSCSGGWLNDTITEPPAPAAPSISASGPTVFCQGDSVVLSTTVTSSGSYTVTAYDTAGCPATSSPFTVTVLVPQVPVITFNNNILSSSTAAGNQWYFNNALIPGETGQDHIPTQSGDYTVAFTDSNGCTAISAPYNVTFTGAGELIEMEGFTVMPNPSDGVFMLRFGKIIPQQVIICNTLGQVVYIATEPDSAIDLSAQPKGSYFIRLITSEEVIIRKILIQ